MITEDRTLDPLDPDECLRLLATESIGRLAVTPREGPPLVVPVNFVVADGSVLFRTGYGAKLRALWTRPVSFEVDHVDPERRTGWSVLVSGRAEEVRRRDRGPVLPDPWVPADKPYLVSVTILGISGRRIRIVDDAGPWLVPVRPAI